MNTSSPAFIRTVDAEFDSTPGTKHPMRFDVYGKDKFFVGRISAKVQMPCKECASCPVP